MIAQLDPLYIKTRPGKVFGRIVSHVGFQGRFATTDYRWLNRLILPTLKGVKRLPQLRTVKQPIFIVGTGRSGSTILGKVLSMHRDIGFLNEPKALWHVIYPNEDLNGHFSTKHAQYRLTAEDTTPQMRAQAHHLFGTYLLVTGSERVVDKNPELLFRIPFVKAIFPDAKFVFLVRNGWDTIFSISRWSRSHGKHVNGKSEDWWGVSQRKWRFMLEQLVPTEPLLSEAHNEIEVLTRLEDMAAVEWILTMQEGLRHMRSSPSDIHLIRYEDLTKQPDDTLGKLITFCELPYDSIFLSYARQTLTEVSSREPSTLSPIIRVPFLETMMALDYPIK